MKTMTEDIKRQAVENGHDAMEAYWEAASVGDAKRMAIALRELSIAEDIYLGRKSRERSVA